MTLAEEIALTVERARIGNRRRHGEDHHSATLSDRQVEKIRRMYAEWKKSGKAQGGGYRVLGKLFKCGESTVRDIVLYRTRKFG